MSGISLQMLRGLMGAKSASGTGQELPPDPAQTGNDAPPPAKPHGRHRPLSSDTMASLFSAQSGPPQASDLAANLLKAIDSNADGSASLEEIQSALAGKSPDATAATNAFNGLDSDGNGSLSAAELASGLENLFASRQGQKAYAAQQASTTTSAATSSAIA